MANRVKEVSAFDGTSWGAAVPLGANDSNIDITSSTTQPDGSAVSGVTGDSATALNTSAVTVSEGDTSASAWTKFNRFRKRVANNFANYIQGSIATSYNATGSNSAVYSTSVLNNYMSNVIGYSGTTTPSAGTVAAQLSSLNDKLIRPNLLDNWYFVGGGSQLGEGVFPINQKGTTSYTSSGRIFDRWVGTTIRSNCSVTLTANGLVLSASGSSSGTIIFDQRFPSKMYNLLKGKTVTASVLVTSVSGSFNLQSCGGYTSLTTPGCHSFTRTVSNDFTFDYGIRIFNASGDASITIAAIKLELGPNQTLASYDNGNWILNAIPNYDIELMKCQRYYIKCNGFFPGYGSSATAFLVTIPTPTTMVSNPSITTSGSGYFVQSTGHTITATSDSGVRFNDCVRFSGTCSGGGLNLNTSGVVSGLTVTLSAEL